MLITFTLMVREMEILCVNRLNSRRPLENIKCFLNFTHIFVKGTIFPLIWHWNDTEIKYYNVFFNKCIEQLSRKYNIYISWYIYVYSNILFTILYLLYLYNIFFYNSLNFIKIWFWSFCTYTCTFIIFLTR